MANKPKRTSPARRSKRKPPVQVTGGGGFRFENPVAARFLLDGEGQRVRIDEIYYPPAARMLCSPVLCLAINPTDRPALFQVDKF